MNGRRIALRLVMGAVLLLGTFLLLTPQQASACDVSIGYRPSVSISDLNHPRTCSTGTSLTGAAVVAVLAIGALAAAGWGAVQRGERESEAASTRQAGPSSTLTTYLNATGIV
ncbi:hypothetical protein ABZ746_39200 [Streptomyces sp. NPDC020096]